MADWYDTHDISPEAAGDDEYRTWAQNTGVAHVDLAGNVFWPGEPGHPDTGSR